MVSVQVINSGDPGSLIGSLYGIHDRTGVSYDTPLRDSGPVRSMTGSYPWKITKDYTTVVYITNISDQEAGFVGEINYRGGNFIVDPRKLQPGETAVFDLRKIRDEQVEDSAGRRLPKETSLGQFKWAVRGVTNGKLLLVGRAEMVSRSQQISTSYSCNDPCPPTYDGWLDPFPPPVVFVNKTGGSAAWEQMYYDWGYTVGPYAVSASWSLSNPIGTLDPNAGHTTLMTGTTPGTAMFEGFIAVYQDYGWDGLNCYEYGTYEGGGEQPVEVNRELTFKRVGYFNLQESFTPGQFRDEATLNLGQAIDGSRICGSGSDREFTIAIEFDFPGGGTIYDRADNRNSVAMGDAANNQFEWIDWGFGTINSTQGRGSMWIKLFRRNLTNSRKDVNFTITGASPPGTVGEFSGRGRVNLNCP